MWGTLLNWLTGGVLDRVLDTVDRRVDAQTDRDRLKADLIKVHMQTRAEFMRAGGFWLMLIFAAPLAFWFAAVIFYSIFLCPDCMHPVGWTIAALPPPLDQWSGGIVLSIFGVIGVRQFRR